MPITIALGGCLLIFALTSLILGIRLVRVTDLNKQGKYIFENMDTPVLVMSEDTRILRMNKRAKALFGQKLDPENLGKLSDIFEISEKESLEYVSRVIASSDEGPCKLSFRLSDVICELRTNAILDEHSEPICIVSFVYDVTREQRAVQELEDLKESLEKSLQEKTKQVEGVALQAITTIANFIDSKEEYTSGHSTRVAKYAEAIAKELGWSDAEVMNMHYVALLHDIGKIGIPYDILNKPSKLTEEEYELVKSHTAIGADILRDIKTVEHVEVGALYHHERYDGSGYPSGLKGDEIPIVARLITLADAFDAMTSNRRYRHRLSDDEVIREIKNNSGKQFDPYLCSVLLRMLEEGTLEIGVSAAELPEYEGLLSESNQLLARIMEGSIANTQAEAERDYLTNLWNRRTGEKHIIQFLRTGEGALLIIDLDNFKLINDTYGHLAGDHALKIIAEVLQHNSRDSILCRMAGDEFLLFLKDAETIEEVKPIVESIINTYDNRMEKESILSHTSLSIGVALSTIEGKDYQELFRCADRALYYIKQNGKCGYSFHNRTEIGGGTNARVDLERLVYALKHKENYHGAFQVEYQEFLRVYEFVEHYTSRNNQGIQLVLFTLDYDKSTIRQMEELDGVMKDLEAVISQGLRGIDISTRFSSAQILVILVDAETKGVQIVIDRILNRFYELYRREDIIIDYDSANLTDSEENPEEK